MAGRNFHRLATECGPTRPVAPANPVFIHPGGEGSQGPGYVIDVDDQLISALDSLRGDVWSCVLRDSTSPVTLLLSLDPSVLDRGLGQVGNIPIPEFLWDFLAPLDFQEVTDRI